MVDRISLDPDPPNGGTWVTICYDFIESGLESTTLLVTFTGVSGTTGYGVTPEDPCVDVWVPDAATWITVVDEKGQSSDASAPVL